MNLKPLFIIIAFIAIVVAAMVKIGAFDSLLSGSEVGVIKARAVEGDARAQLELAKRYLHGVGVVKSEYEALNWALVSANQSYAPAMRMVGIMYSEGQGSDPHPDAAVRWLNQAYDASDEMAAFLLGEMYETGNGVEKDVKKAKQWFRKGADRGEAWAQYGLAHYYRDLAGDAIDLKESARLYLLSARQGNQYAQNELGWLYKHGLGVERDLQKAEMWYRKSFEQGNRQAANNLAWMLSTAKEEGVRNGKAALKAVEGINIDLLPSTEQAAILDTYAASYAEVGRFVDAVMAQQKVIAIQKDLKFNREMIEAANARLHAYQQKKAWRE